MSGMGNGAQHDMRVSSAELAIRWRNGDTGNRLDCETAVLLRTYLRPVFEGADSWSDLVTGLGDKGFGLAFRAGRLVLTDLETQVRICTARFLGMPLADLAARLGRPCVKAVPGTDAEGTLLA